MTIRAVSLRLALVLSLSSCGMGDVGGVPPADDQAGRQPPTTTSTQPTMTATQPTTTTTQPTTTTTVATTTTTVPATTTTTVPPRVCEPAQLESDIRSGADARAVTLVLSRALHSCADHLVVSDLHPDRLRAASRLALAEGGSLLVTDPQPSPEQLEEIRRLQPSAVTSFGVTVPGGEWTLHQGRQTGAVEPPPMPSAGDVTWLVRGEGDLASAVAPAAAAAGAAVLAIDIADPRALAPDVKQRLVASKSVRLVGDHSDSASWQLQVVRAGAEIPGGGQLMFPGRRLLALYGSPRTASLGALGERDPAGSLEAIEELAPDYATDGATILPTFELIATVAAAEPGSDGNYSEELSPEDLTPWVDYAAEHGAYVVLDLQPGRSDFLTQAKRYEALLRKPHVGLALDPEWRLASDEEHLDQIGTVTAEEINTVVGWLAQLVREERIPQKLLVIHQFKFSMITEREAIRTPSELAVVVHMDGQGPLTTKFSTYRALVAAGDSGWRWGWKNFFDEDSPMATPEQVLGVEPPPVFVSFQ